MTTDISTDIEYKSLTRVLGNKTLSPQDPGLTHNDHLRGGLLNINPLPEKNNNPPHFLKKFSPAARFTRFYFTPRISFACGGLETSDYPIIHIRAR